MTMLLNVNPRPMVDDLPDRWFGHTELARNNAVPGSVRDESADLADVLISEDRVRLPFPTAHAFRMDVATVTVTGRDAFRMGSATVPLPTGHKPSPRGVGEVLANGGPLKVRSTVVLLVPVDVVNGLLRPASNKGVSNKTMDGALVAYTIDAQSNAKVAVPQRGRAQHDACPLASHPTHVRHGVNPLVPDNGKPAFGGIFGFSHRVPPQQVPWSGPAETFAASRRAASIVSQAMVA